MECQILCLEQRADLSLERALCSPEGTQAASGDDHASPSLLEQGYSFFASTSSTAPASSVSLPPKEVASPGLRSSNTSRPAGSG